MAVTSTTSRLRPVVGRPGLVEYLRELGRRREFIATMPRHDLKAQNMDTVLGNVWLLLNPLLLSAVYLLIFGALLEADRGVDNYIAYLVIGTLVFRYFTSALTSSSRVMWRNQTLVRSIYFPRAALPLASAIGAFYTFLPSLIVVVVTVLATGEQPDLDWLYLPVVLLIAFAFMTGTVMIGARLGHVFGDLHSLLPHLTRLAFYASGTLYDPARFTENRLVLTFFDVNPMYQILSLARWTLMDYEINSWFFLTAPAWALAVLILGFVYFWQGETSYGSQR